MNTPEPYSKALAKQIKKLAKNGRSPAEIEKILGLPPYTIHYHYHRELMAGYAKCSSMKRDLGGYERPTRTVRPHVSNNYRCLSGPEATTTPSPTKKTQKPRKKYTVRRNCSIHSADKGRVRKSRSVRAKQRDAACLATET